MVFYDFEYDGVYLSHLGYMVCCFDFNGIQTSTGSEISFDTVPLYDGRKRTIVSTKYENSLTTTFQICKKLCNGGNYEISVDEYRRLNRWLNRKQFLKFKILNDEMMTYYFNASFNVSPIEKNSKLVGLELSMITDSPFAYQDTITISKTFSSANSTLKIAMVSDEEGFIYPKMTIKVKSSGDLKIYNESELRHTVVSNCTNNEVITFEYPLISTNDESHIVQNDFNWNFFRLYNTYSDNVNTITFSLPCEVTMEYTPFVKISI